MSEYSGVDNLEVLVDAVRYNAYLVREVVTAAGEAGRALDFGAGIGTFAKAVRDTGLDVACVEPDDEMRAGLEADGLEAHADLTTVGEVPYVYSLNVLEHIEDDGAALAGLAGVLAPGGTLMLYVPAFQVLFSAMDRKVGHFRRYHKGQLVALVQQAGLDVEQARYVDCLGFAASLVYKAVGSRQGDLSPGSVKLYDRAVFPVSRVLDRLLQPLLGKNLLVVARRP